MSVGVIVVHGVADQAPDASAAEIVDLLANLDLPAAAGPAYGPFVEERLQLPVRPLPAPPAPAVAAPSTATFRERSQSLRAAERVAVGANSLADAAAAPRVDVNIEFMSTLIAGYEPQGPDETYSTTVRRTTRRASGAAPAVETAIYEMYWADLSRLSTNWLRIFTEFYQLMFHLGSLGLHCISAARVAERDSANSRTWAAWQWTQAAAVNALAIWMVVPNLIQIGLTAILLLRFVGPHNRWVGPRIAGTVGFLVAGYVLYRLMKAFESVRPGAVRASALMGAIVATTFFATLYGVWPRNPAEVLLQAAAVRASEVAFVLLGLAWTWLILNMLASAGLGAWVTLVRGATFPKMRRVVWTATLTLVLQALTFTIVTTVLWGALALAIDVTYPAFAAAPHPAFIVGRVFRIDGEQTVGAMSHAMIVESSGIGFGLTVGLAAVALLILVAFVGPAARFEAKPGAEGITDSRWWSPGPWLTRGFGVLRISGGLLILGMLFLMPLGSLASVFHARFDAIPLYEKLRWLTAWFLTIGGSVIVASAVGLTAFRDRLKGLVLHMRVVLDAALDVDNYLREHPRGNTPRARIVSRYVSLLRHVLAQGHDRIVIIAHSQGTVITADLLRYLHWQESQSPGYLAATSLGHLASTNARPATPVRFFTMGCPLRQIYGLRFPHLYEWTRYAVAPSMPNDDSEIPLGTAPVPSEIQVETWVNAYRSADYVGRHLWRPDACAYMFEARTASNGAHPWQAGPFNKVESFDTNRTRREFCIGRGAHTHYWDGAAPQIALTLDELISN